MSGCQLLNQNKVCRWACERFLSAWSSHLLPRAYCFSDQKGLGSDSVLQYFMESNLIFLLSFMIVERQKDEFSLYFSPPFWPSKAKDLPGRDVVLEITYTKLGHRGLSEPVTSGPGGSKKARGPSFSYILSSTFLTFISYSRMTDSSCALSFQGRPHLFLPGRCCGLS